MKKKLIILISIILIVTLGAGGFILYKNTQKQKLIESIESIALKMYELEGIDNYKIKTTETAKYEGKDYIDTGVVSYDIKRKTLKREGTSTEFWESGEIWGTIPVEYKEYCTFDGKIEKRYNYNEYDKVWENTTYKIEEWEILVDYKNLSAVEIFKDIKYAELIKEENGIKEYKIIISKNSVDEIGWCSLEDLIDDATYIIQIKDNYIIKVETELSKWCNDSVREKYKDIKETFELYDFNETEVTIPEEVINNSILIEY